MPLASHAVARGNHGNVASSSPSLEARKAATRRPKSAASPAKVRSRTPTAAEQFENMPSDAQWWKLEARRMLETLNARMATQVELQAERKAARERLAWLQQACVQLQDDREARVDQARSAVEEAIQWQAKVCAVRPNIEAARARLAAKRREMARLRGEVETWHSRLLDAWSHIDLLDERAKVEAKKRVDNTAAAKIQSMYRGKRDRKLVEDLRSEKAVAEQAAREELASMKIQSIYRGKNDRKVAEERRKQKEKRDKEEAEERRKEKEKRDREEAAAATKIQSRYRGKLARQELQIRRQEEQKRDVEETAAAISERKKQLEEQARLDQEKWAAAEEAEKNRQEKLRREAEVAARKRCPCGNILASDSIFCRKCGRRRSDVQVCSCGTPLVPGAASCRRCGRKTEATQAMKQEAALKIQRVYRGHLGRRRAAAVKREAGRVAAVKYCICGQTFMDDAEYCRFCGQRRRDLDVCECGNILIPEATFCRKCGAKRQFNEEANPAWMRAPWRQTSAFFDLGEFDAQPRPSRAEEEKPAQARPIQRSTLQQEQGDILKRRHQLLKNGRLGARFRNAAKRALVQAKLTSVNKSALAVVQQKAKEQLIEAYQSGRLEESLDKRNKEKANSIDDLRQKAKEQMVQAYQSGRLAESLDKRNQEKANSIDDLRLMAKEQLVQAYHSGQLEVSMDRRRREKGEMTANVLWKAMEHLVKANKNGSLAKSLAKRTRELALRKQAKKDLVKAHQSGTLAEVMDKRKREKEKAKVVPPNAADIRKRAREQLVQAHQSGSLSQALARRKEEAEALASVFSDVARRALQHLMQASRDGRLAESLKKRSAEMKAKTNTMRAKAKAGLKKACLDGSLQEAVSKRAKDQSEATEQLALNEKTSTVKAKE